MAPRKGGGILNSPEKRSLPFIFILHFEMVIFIM